MADSGVLLSWRKFPSDKHLFTRNLKALYNELKLLKYVTIKVSHLKRNKKEDINIKKETDRALDHFYQQLKVLE